MTLFFTFQSSYKANCIVCNPLYLASFIGIMTQIHPCCTNHSLLTIPFPLAAEEHPTHGHGMIHLHIYLLMDTFNFLTSTIKAAINFYKQDFASVFFFHTHCTSAVVKYLGHGIFTLNFFLISQMQQCHAIFPMAAYGVPNYFMSSSDHQSFSILDIFRDVQQCAMF